MLKSVKKNKKYILGIVTIGLFGIAGFLLAAVAKYIAKAANRYPKAFGWIFAVTTALLCVLGVLHTQNWNKRILIVCIGAAVAINSITAGRRKGETYGNSEND